MISDGLFRRISIVGLVILSFALMGLIPMPPGRITTGSARLNGVEAEQEIQEPAA